jgi:sortase (surface protein transpeptidase)
MSKLLRVLILTSLLSFGSAILVAPGLGLLHASHAEASISNPVPQQAVANATSSTPPESFPVSTSTAAENTVVKNIEVIHQPLAKISDPAYPVRLSIPSIKLNNLVVPVGVTSAGEMDVPSGATDSVGWYKYGTVPGNIGSAVMDAHVFAAFSDLHKLHAGDAIDVVMSDGTARHFIVSDTETYALADVPAETLFNAADGRHLNLITCAGALLPNHSTYDHRLIVYATLDENSH